MSEYGMSNDSAIQNRKFAKTCVEKKRRDRINRCLDELKDLMSQADDKAKYQKMEKAEILEMAVNYMKTMRSKQSEQYSSSTTTNNNAQYYGLAFRQCLNEFQNYLALFPGIKDDFKSKIMSYMTQRYMESLTNSNTNSSTKSNLKRTMSNRYTPYNSQSERQSVKQQQQQQNNENLITVITNAVDQQNISSHSSNSSFSSSSYFYNSDNTNTNNKFGGSCSSLDGFQFQKQNQTTTLMMHNDSHNESSNSDNIMSPAMSSPCSSPVSSHTNQLIDNNNKFNMMSSSNSSSSSSSPVNYYSNYEDFMKVWRPW